MHGLDIFPPLLLRSRMPELHPHTFKLWYLYSLITVCLDQEKVPSGGLGLYCNRLVILREYHTPFASCP
jgi:hypothetical protein